MWFVPSVLRAEPRPTAAAVQKEGWRGREWTWSASKLNIVGETLGGGSERCAYCQDANSLHKSNALLLFLSPCLPRRGARARASDGNNMARPDFDVFIGFFAVYSLFIRIRRFSQKIHSSLLPRCEAFVYLLFTILTGYLPLPAIPCPKAGLRWQSFAPCAWLGFCESLVSIYGHTETE